MKNNLTGFEYPRSLEDALAILKERGAEARPIGGGTSLVVNPGPRTRVLVDLSRVGLTRLSRENGHIALGAMLTARALGRAPLLAATGLQALREAAWACGSRLLQNQITLGGNIVGLYPWSDLPPVLMALGARVRIRSKEKAREVSLEDLVARHPTRQLAPDELVVEVVVPVPPSGSALSGSARNASANEAGPQDVTPPSDEGSSSGFGAAFLKFTRTAVDYTLCDVAVAVSIHEGVVTAASVVASALRPLPARLATAEQALLGKEPTETAFADASRAAMAEALIAKDFRASCEYRRELLGVLVRRALETACHRALGRRSV